MNTNLKFGLKLRELRKQAGLSLRELAASVNIDFTYLSKIENGVLPPPSEKVILHLAESLKADKDELLALAGKIPPDIAEILKNRETIKRLRAEQAKKEAKAMNQKDISMPRVHIPFKSLYRLALPVFLVIAIGLSIWYAAPTPVKALEITYSSLPATATIGSTYTFHVNVSIQDTEHLPLERVDVIIYNVASPSTYIATLTNMPLGTTSSTAHNPSEGTTSGTATVSSTADATWGYTVSGTGYAYWKGTGYSFVPATSGGYGYQGGTGTTSIEYIIVWTPPSSWIAGSYKIDTTLTTSTKSPGSGTTFTETSSAFTLSAATSTAPVSGGGTTSTTTGTTFVYNVVTSTGKFTQNVIAQSGDNQVSLNIPSGVTGLTSAGAPLTRIDIAPMSTPPTPPANQNIIGLTYNFGPDGATFDPPITITFTYNPANIPAGVSANDLKIAVYNATTGAWVVLEGITVDPVNHTISGKVSHFTAFAVLSPSKAAPAPTATAVPPTTAAPKPTVTTAPPTTAAAPTVTTAPPTTAVPKPTVTTAPPTTAAPVPTPTPTGGANWWLIGGIIIVVIIIAVIVGVVIVRRRNG